MMPRTVRWACRALAVVPVVHAFKLGVNGYVPGLEGDRPVYPRNTVRIPEVEGTTITETIFTTEWGCFDNCPGITETQTERNTLTSTTWGCYAGCPGVATPSTEWRTRWFVVTSTSTVPAEPPRATTAGAGHNSPCVVRCPSAVRTSYVTVRDAETVTVPLPVPSPVTVVFTAVETTVFPGQTLTITGSGPVSCPASAAATSTRTRTETTVLRVGDPAAATFTSTLKVSPCPAPTNTAPVPSFDPYSDRTWGCFPGFVCNPPFPPGCTHWESPPADDYVCEPGRCKPATALRIARWPPNGKHRLPAYEGYFDLDPRPFGLTFDVFGREILVVVQNAANHTVSPVAFPSSVSFSYASPATTSSGDTGTGIHSHPLCGSYPSSSCRATTTTTTTTTTRTATTSVCVGEAAAAADSPYGGSGTPLRPRQESAHFPNGCLELCDPPYGLAQLYGKDTVCREIMYQTGLDECRTCVDQRFAGQRRTELKNYVEDVFGQFNKYCAGSGAVPAKNATSTQSAVSGI